jgi:transposase
MGNPAGVKRDFLALERRRLLAARLLERGVSEAEVARRVGAHRQSVNRWARQLRDGGRKALKKAGRAGRKPALTPTDLERIRGGLKQGPMAWGYHTNLWTLPRVAALIEQECGVRFHPGHVWRVLRNLGWSCQRPSGRALELDEEKIRVWKKERWPALKKTPKQAARRSSSSTRAD